MYEAVFTTWVGVALAALAAIMLLLAMRGDLSQQARRGLVAVLALGLAAAAYAAPIQWSRALDGVLLDGVTAMQQGFLRQVGVGDQNTLPTVLTDQIVYSNWLRGEFGSADVPQARDLGRPLLEAQTFTKVEVATGQDGQAQADAKKQQFTDIANKVGDRYSYFQGRSGSRVGAGALALVQALCIALFQLMSKVLVLVSMLMIRLLVMVAPALAVVALLKPEVLPAMLRIGGAALVNTLLVGALAGLHSLLVISLFRPGSGVDTWLALLVTGVVTVILWAVARPFRRLTSMVSLTREQVGGIVPAAGGGALGRAFGRLRGGDGLEESWWGERVERRRGGAGLRPEESVDDAGRARPARTVHVPSEVVRPPSEQTGSVPRREIDASRPALPRGTLRVTEVDGAPSQRIYRPSSRPAEGRGQVVEGRVLESRVERGAPDSARDPPRGPRVPIRTRRGRSGAYRSLWEWPLHSPVRFLFVLVVLAVVGRGDRVRRDLGVGGLGPRRRGARTGPGRPDGDGGPERALRAAPGAGPDHAAALGRPARRARRRAALGDGVGRPPGRGHRSPVERPPQALHHRRVPAGAGVGRPRERALVARHRAPAGGGGAPGLAARRRAHRRGDPPAARRAGRDR